MYHFEFLELLVPYTAFLPNLLLYELKSKCGKRMILVHCTGLKIFDAFYTNVYVNDLSGDRFVKYSIQKQQKYIAYIY